MGALDYVYADTMLHRLNPLSKLFLAVMLCVGSIITDSVIMQTAYLILIFCVAYLGAVSSNVFRLFKGLINPCLFIVLLQIIFVRRGQVLFFFVTDEGLISAYVVAMRVMNASLSMSMVLTITKMTDLANALVLHARLNYRYAFVVTTALRFVPILMDELNEIKEAQTARGVQFDTAKGIRKFQLVLPLCAPLLINAIRRTDSSAVAAEVRGFHLRTRTSGYKTYEFHGRDLVCTVLCVILVVLCVLGNIYLKSLPYFI